MVGYRRADVVTTLPACSGHAERTATATLRLAPYHKECVMSVFGKILEKLGLRKDAAQPKMANPSQAGAGTPASRQAGGGTAGSQRQSGPTGHAAPAARPAAPPPPPSRPAAMSEVDVTARLEKLAELNPQQLNWRTSIVDLMKLLGMESSLAERKELAAELGYPKDQMDDSARMNVWLHKQVLRKIAENGGKVPQDLLD